MDQGTNEMAVQGTERKKRKALSAETKYEIFLETSRKDVPAAEVLRRYGLHTSDLQRIREKVRSGALKELGGAARGVAVNPASEAVRRLEAEKARLEQALVELTIENQLLKKRTNSS